MVRCNDKLFHHNLFNHDLGSCVEMQEVDAFGHAAAIDLVGAAGSTVGHHLAHAVVKHIAVLSVAALEVQGVLDRVGIDADAAVVLVNAPDLADLEALRLGVAYQILGNDAVLGALNRFFVDESGIGGLSDLFATASDDEIEGIVRSNPCQHERHVDAVNSVFQVSNG